jgi:RNA polymerase sigma-70 factor (ECF subfamily)
VAALVRAVSDSLVRYAFCMVGEINAAEDIALKAIADFVYRNAHHGLPKSYLWRATYTKAIDYLRKKRREVPLEGLEDVLSAGDTAQDSVEREERHRVLYTALRSLPKDYRNVLYLHVLDGFSIPETAKVMGKNVKQVYNLLARGKVALREWFAKEGYSYEDL